LIKICIKMQFSACFNVSIKLILSHLALIDYGRNSRLTDN
jgi:hypothetical protein